MFDDRVVTRWPATAIEWCLVFTHQPRDTLDGYGAHGIVMRTDEISGYTVNQTGVSGEDPLF